MLSKATKKRIYQNKLRRVACRDALGRRSVKVLGIPPVLKIKSVLVTKDNNVPLNVPSSQIPRELIIQPSFSQIMLHALTPMPVRNELSESKVTVVAVKDTATSITTTCDQYLESVKDQIGLDHIAALTVIPEGIVVDYVEYPKGT